MVKIGNVGVALVGGEGEGAPMGKKMRFARNCIRPWRENALASTHKLAMVT